MKNSLYFQDPLIESRVTFRLVGKPFAETATEISQRTSRHQLQSFKLVDIAHRTRTHGLRLPYVGYRTVSPLPRKYDGSALCRSG